jgi:LytS/YehU family sensor histidine kinase
VVRVQNELGVLRVSVEDTGPGFAGSGSSFNRDGAGVGLANVRRRLNLSYGPEATLDIVSSEFGSKVSFAIPDTANLPAAKQEVQVAS